MSSLDQITEAVLAFVNARTWIESKQIINAHRDELLTDAADELLASLLEHYRDDREATRILQEHRTLLSQCRREGIESAFSDRLHLPEMPHKSDLTALLEELQSLTDPEDLSQAIIVGREALALVSRDREPELWATLHSYLGDAHLQLLQANSHESSEQAIHHFERALEVYTVQSFPEQWAYTQNMLANAYRERIRGDRAQNIEMANQHYRQALTIYEREAFPVNWAMTQYNLANTYANRIRGDRAQNLEQAILHYHRALEVYTRQDFPKQWADVQNNLGNAFHQRILGERAENYEQAILHYHRALEVRTARAFPQDSWNTAYALANLLYEERWFSEARRVFTIAHEAAEVLRSESHRAATKRDFAELNATLYARLVHCFLLEGDEEAAYEYAVAAKGRAFVDLLATTRLDLSVVGTDDPQLAEDLHKAEKLRSQIGNLLAHLSVNNAASHASSFDAGTRREEMRAELRARQEEHDALWEEMTYKYPILTTTQQAPAFTAGEARALAADLGARLVEYYRHAAGWCAFVVTPEELRCVPLPRC